jgi:hypothetical protein
VLIQLLVDVDLVDLGSLELDHRAGGRLLHHPTVDLDILHRHILHDRPRPGPVRQRRADRLGGG